MEKIDPYKARLEKEDEDIRRGEGLDGLPFRTPVGALKVQRPAGGENAFDEYDDPFQAQIDAEDLRIRR